MPEHLEVRFFGTYDAGRHPRTAVIREGLRDCASVTETNVPVPIDTAMRVEALRLPLRLLGLVPLVLAAWWRLAIASRRGPYPDVVVVGHLGHFDVLLARLLYPRARLCLDYLISLADTAEDRALAGTRLKSLPLRVMDWCATRVADDVLVDTPQSLATVPKSNRGRATVVPVGAERAWFETSPAPPTDSSRPATRVVFFGLFTPLQGTPVIGKALKELSDRGIQIQATLVGTGQDWRAAKEAARGAEITWIDWVDSGDLPQVVADHDICLGIFGTGVKALRVVPNKVYQGAAAGCVIVTSDTKPQRSMLGDVGVYVPAGDSGALAAAIASLANDPSLPVRRLRTRTYAQRHFASSAVVRPLIEHFQATLDQ